MSDRMPHDVGSCTQADATLAQERDGRIAAERALEEARQEIERLRVKNTELNNRATKAESQVLTTVEDCRRQGVSLGRGLANAGYSALEARAEQAESRVSSLERENTLLREVAKRAREVRATVDELCTCHTGTICWGHFHVAQELDPSLQALKEFRAEASENP